MFCFDFDLWALCSFYSPSHSIEIIKFCITHSSRYSVVGVVDVVAVVGVVETVY